MSLWCCIASGPSLTSDDCEAVRGRARTIVVNDNYRIAPWADALYAADLEWWHQHYEHARADFEGRMYTVETNSDPKNPRIGNQLYGLRVLKQEPKRELKHTGLSAVPGVLRLGGFSGYQAVNLAYLWGAKTILLLGYDFRTSQGQHHWFGKHKKLRNGKNFDSWMKRFETIRPAECGIEIVNCSRDSALQSLPRMTIHEALEKYA